MGTAFQQLDVDQSDRGSVPSSWQRLPWLFSPWIDLATFLGSAVAALALVAVGGYLGLLNSDSPEWTWITTVLLIDVAHVWATCFRVYFDPVELRRRAWLYVLTPLLAFAIGWAVYSESTNAFWTLLAYLAVFHFVRQQYGWVALYRSRAGESSRFSRCLDQAAIYLATLFPLVWWHAHLPRRFWWFVESDFVVRVPETVSAVAEAVYWLTLAVYFARSLHEGVIRHRWNPGKDIVVMTTALCWHLGIITFNSDYAFTVTNVIIHGVPYFVIVYWFRFELRGNTSDTRPSGEEVSCTPSQVLPMSRQVRTIVVFVGTLWLLAFVEELLWDRAIWHERGWLFGSGWDTDRWRTVLVPLLSVPQITHYVLDGFIWKRRHRSTNRR